jgi:hypothetical protein
MGHSAPVTFRSVSSLLLFNHYIVKYQAGDRAMCLFRFVSTSSSKWSWAAGMMIDLRGGVIRNSRGSFERFEHLLHDDNKTMHWKCPLTVFSVASSKFRGAAQFYHSKTCDLS